MTDWNSDTQAMRGALRQLSKTLPETTKGFSTLTGAAKSEGPLDLKTREMIAVGIAVAERCEPCISFHVDAFIKAGGTREEMAAVLAVCIQMGGGPSLMYAAKTLVCYDTFAA